MYGRKYGVWQAACSASAVDVRAGDDRRRGLLLGDLAGQVRAGQDRDPVGPAPVTSQMTSLIRLVPSSMPFISDSSVASDGSSGDQPVRFSRSDCEGTARTTIDASSSASAGSAVARTAAGSRIPGR